MENDEVLKKDIKSTVRTDKVKISKAAKKKSDNRKPQGEAIVCTYHGGLPLSVHNDNFYKSNEQSLFKAIGYIPICKKCVKDIFLRYYYDNNNDYIKALYLMCRKLDILFEVNSCEGAFKKSKGRTEAIFGNYLGIIGGGARQDRGLLNFDDSEYIDEDKDSIDMKVSKIRDGYQLCDNDLQHMKDVVKKLGYDPFKSSGLKEYDLAQLYSEMVTYLEDDDLVTDSYKLNVVLQIIHNNQQIRQTDLYLSILNSGIGDFTENASRINTLIGQKEKLIKLNNSTKKENGWLTMDTTGRNTLSGMMKKLGEYGFDEIHANYFDIATSKSAKEMLDASHKSIIETLNFGDEEAKDVLVMQRELITEKDDEIAKIFEEKRQLALELVDIKKKLRLERETEKYNL